MKKSLIIQNKDVRISGRLNILWEKEDSCGVYLYYVCKYSEYSQIWMIGKFCNKQSLAIEGGA